eukprot:CAMPEP_0206470396 /NCGR_PEP_ID=MMETSP0324_2-20121206/30904_1 /ASSEMBLY_ACC=CAM_ASM_000836 /TAXON_ID=2866 /ORGANISM="Crypthecodinium cohnii, Strain Seligo" /LENGTH=492 /DNA_ID=CAMNT_0053944445 /DNA_START=195 /DNA_END=1673 /DNA_ORIENTATION=+
MAHGSGGSRSSGVVRLRHCRPECDSLDASISSQETDTLRKLRESLSNLEKLEKHRSRLNDPALEQGWRTTQPPTTATSPTTVATPTAARRARGSSSVPSAASPSVSPPRPSPVPHLTESEARQSTFSAWRHEGRGTADPASLDAALTSALEQSQQQLEALQKQSDAYHHKALQQEAEAARLLLQLNRSESERKRLQQEHHEVLERRGTEVQELQRLRAELREAWAEAASSSAALEHQKLAAEEREQALRASLEEQESKVQYLEETSARSQELFEAFRSCLDERAPVLRFLSDLLKENHALLFAAKGHDRPTPQIPSLEVDKSPLHQERLHQPRSARLLPRRDELEALLSARMRPKAKVKVKIEVAVAVRIGALRAAAARPRREEVNADNKALRELSVALATELRNTERQLLAQVRKVSAQAQAVDRLLERRPEHGSLLDGWLDAGTVSRLDWAEEQAKWEAQTKVAQTKFSQLGKIEHLLKSRRTASSLTRS